MVLTYVGSGIHLAQLPPHKLPHEIPDFQLTDHKGKIFTHNNLKNEFAVLLFGTIDSPDTKVRSRICEYLQTLILLLMQHTEVLLTVKVWLERLGKMVCESGTASPNHAPRKLVSQPS